MADNSGVLNLDVVDVFQTNIRENVTVLLRNQDLQDKRFFKNRPAEKTIRLDGLIRTPQGRYVLEVDAPSYQPVSQLIRIPAAGDLNLTVMVPVDPARVTSMVRPRVGDLQPDLKGMLDNAGIAGFDGKKGADLYSALPDIPCAGLLNLVAKARHTRLSSGRAVVSYLQSMINLYGDRLFSRVGAELLAECKRSVDVLKSVDGALHDLMTGFVLKGSFKTFDRYGNLQLTLSTNPASGEWIVDMDIDDAQGLEHIFQVVRNTVTGEPTHPYNIHEILAEDQKIDPGYELKVGESFQSIAA